MQVSSTFVSCIDAVGGEDGIQKNVLLATSSASRLTGSPAEVDLSDLSVMPEQFNYQHLPVAASLEGIFPSVFAHRMTPEGIQTTTATRKQSVHTKQVVVASGNVARNETEQGRPLPVGYDRYSKMQFGNRDFLVNAILWLTDDSGLISLRQKVFTMRLLNDHKSHQALTKIRIISILTPVLLLLLIGCTVLGVRKHLYTL